MWAWPRWRRTTLPFLLSTSALSLERRGRDRVNSMRSFSSSAATRWLTYSEPLSAWKPLTAKGKSPRRPSSTGIRKRSEMASTAPTNSYWVIADRKRSDVHQVDLVDALAPVEVALGARSPPSRSPAGRRAAACGARRSPPRTAWCASARCAGAGSSATCAGCTDGRSRCTPGARSGRRRTPRTRAASRPAWPAPTAGRAARPPPPAAARPPPCRPARRASTAPRRDGPRSARWPRAARSAAPPAPATDPSPSSGTAAAAPCRPCPAARRPKRASVRLVNSYVDSRSSPAKSTAALPATNIRTSSRVESLSVSSFKIILR